MSHAGNSDHADAHHDELPQGTMRGYVTGFVLAAVLTIIPFWLVMGGVFDNRTITILAIMVCAVIQIVVHMVFFLHMDPRSEGGWTLLALGFTIIIVVIMIAGSLWVMYHLNANVMPLGREMNQSF
ncbi:MAG: cytochrome o ubiquinol oxidase subunit IV [Mesorhizobium sp.]|nr:cytochrome o ubiquinol oxidase subunit IV [Mesorhizobium sp.]MBL8575712.1 cytochrome o ubiquinol oxidase subunit IV [Mesorhizobium sp.]